VNEWQPRHYHDDPRVNAILNLAAATAEQAAAGRRIAEAIDHVDDRLGLGLAELCLQIHEASGSVDDIVNAVDGVKTSIDCRG